MKMYRKQKTTATSIELNQSSQGETLEQKIERIVNNSEPITDGSPVNYTERKDGVRPEYNPRTDTMELAIEAMDKVTATHRAKRQSSISERKDALDKLNGKKEDGEAKSTQGQGNQGNTTE